ncbi:MAG: ThuA domain-containing protein [Flavobacteriales bacterium]|jgi:type 1 glutamine amidotransferase|nr:ThuA domain-containing protein [Flavobacteriales bacterium]
MTRILFGIVLLHLLTDLNAQQVLHFTATSGFDHGTRDVSLVMFEDIAAELGLNVIDAPNGASFPDATALADMDVIIFSNTSGNNILTAQQRVDLESWVANGGHVLGIHAASDTYRHSTANGNNTGTWDFYAELIGASVQENPNHVNGTPPYEMAHIGTHPSTSALPDPWLKNEEYYYWEGGYFGPDNSVVLQVEETIGPNGQVNSYDAPRAMSWYRVQPNGSRIFYTALGHAGSNYTDDELFRQHMKDALGWLLDITNGTATIDGDLHIRIQPVPANDELTVLCEGALTYAPLRVLDASGRIVLQATRTGERTVLPVNTLAVGTYLLQLENASVRFQVLR